MSICFTRPLCHGMDRLHTASPPPRRRLPQTWGLPLGTYNIHDFRGFGLAHSIWVVYLGSFGIMLLTKTKITSEAYCHNRLVYNMVCSPVVTMVTGGA